MSLLHLVLLLAVVIFIRVLSQRVKEESRHISDKINKLDHVTKQQILMMTKSGVPKNIIAQKISYVVGNE